MKSLNALLVIWCLLLTSCGGGGGSSSGGNSGSGSQQQNAPVFNLSGTVTLLSHFLINESVADSTIPTCLSTCDKAVQKCATLSLVSNSSASDIVLCDTEVDGSGHFNFEITNHSTLKNFLTKVSIINFDGNNREILQYVNSDSTSSVSLDVNPSTTASVNIIKNDYDNNPNSVKNTSGQNGQQLQDDLIGMCPGRITSDNVLDKIKNNLNNLSDSTNSALLVLYHNRIANHDSLADIQGPLDQLCGVINQSPAPLSPVVGKISSGENFSCAINTTGGVKCWGYNANGQLGDGTNNDRSTPTNVVGLSSGVIAISSSSQQTCALLNTGGVKCWGMNTYGQLGDGTTTDHSTPVDVVGLSSGVASISVGMGTTCAILNSGAVKCWGYNGQGGLGDGSTTDKYIPVDVIGLPSKVTSISAGWTHTCALFDTGGVKCWGQGYFIGGGSPFSNGIIGISAGTLTGCVLNATGGVKCWGFNNWGGVGDGTTTTDVRYSPVDVVGLSSGVVFVTESVYHSCALLASGGVKCWGYNDGGQLGDGTTTDRSSPVSVNGLSNGVVAIAPGGHHSCALLSTGTIKCWGSNQYGELGNGSTTNNLSPINVSGI